MQVAGQRQLHKADPLEQGYTVVGFGSHCVPKMLSLALAMHDAAAALSSKAAAAGGGVRWRLRIGIAKGSVVTGGMGSSRQRCHFFGEAVAEAVRLARECDGGETRVQRGVSKAEGSQTFVFQRLPCPPAPSAPAAAARRPPPLGPSDRPGPVRPARSGPDSDSAGGRVARVGLG